MLRLLYILTLDLKELRCVLTVMNTTFDDFTPCWRNRLVQVESNIFVLITAGRLHYRLNGEPYTAQKGDLLFIPKGTLREAYNAADTLHQKYAVFFSGTLPGFELPFLIRSRYHVQSVEPLDPFKACFHSMYRCSLDRSEGSRIMQLGLFIQFLGMLDRRLKAPPLPKRKKIFAAHIEDYIAAHYRESIPLAQLARLIGRSPNYTLALFKEATGVTPLDFQIRLRLKAAKDLLENTSMSVSAIADELGYCDSSYFNKAFTRHVGLSPAAFRARVSPGAEPGESWHGDEMHRPWG
ncbi:helix-turn-helix domain-containing protein [Paenibacillus sp. JSM ZJ436]|uniref:AraC family transcriptional regulator n=1 Tax=Paenibacillus sp. JSM ZJ436 TaxID=3376190 RepID=UPI0037908040